MNVAVDIGNTRIKCGLFESSREEDNALNVWNFSLPPKEEELDVCSFLREPLSRQEGTITWRIAQTGSFPLEKFQRAILAVRPCDQFNMVSRQQIPLKIEVDVPEQVGIDRLLAAFAAVKKYGNVPMLIVDAGTATTIDVVYDQTFCGGAILPGLTVLSATYPKISEKLPLVSLSDDAESYEITLPIYPGRNTKDAIRNGLYWGTIGAIRQLYEIVFSKTGELQLLLTGGDAKYLLRGLKYMVPEQWIHFHDDLVLAGINWCRFQ